MYKYILPVSLFLLVMACGHQKHTTATNGPKNPHASNEKSVVDPNLNPESRPDYNPSATRFTDILHTKLDVRFDWKRRYLYGKATITAHPYFYPASVMELD